jgi:prepilin-type processing-associated H-X9-DG protein
LANIHDIPDNANNTILVMELPESDIIWTEPRDLTFEQVCKEIETDPDLKIFAAHEKDCGFFFLPEKGMNVAFADGHVDFLPSGFLRKYLKSMLTRDGGEEVDFDDMPLPRLNWPRITALIIWAMTLIALLWPQGKKYSSRTEVASSFSKEKSE